MSEDNLSGGFNAHDAQEGLVRTIQGSHQAWIE